MPMPSRHESSMGPCVMTRVMTPTRSVRMLEKASPCLAGKGIVEVQGDAPTDGHGQTDHHQQK